MNPGELTFVIKFEQLFHTLIVFASIATITRNPSFPFSIIIFVFPPFPFNVVITKIMNIVMTAIMDIGMTIDHHENLVSPKTVCVKLRVSIVGEWHLNIFLSQKAKQEQKKLVYIQNKLPK